MSSLSWITGCRKVMLRMLMSTGLGCSRMASREALRVLAQKSPEQNMSSVNCWGSRMKRQPGTISQFRPLMRSSRFPAVHTPMVKPFCSEFILKYDFFYIFYAANITIYTE